MTASLRDTRLLVDVAMGRKSADVVIRGGRWVCVQTGEIVSHTDIAIKAGRVAYVGPDASHTIGRRTEVIRAAGRFLVPGLLDGHVHVESGMVTISEFVRAVTPHGTTGIFADPHEIANVFGLKGVRLMVDEAARQPIHVWIQMPSCVPSAPGLESAGARIGPREVAEAMTWPGIIGLGEMMNFPAVEAGDASLLDEMVKTARRGKTVGGHYASLDLGRRFHAYAAAGAEDDHEGTRLQDAIARARQGMKPMLRYGSAWHDVASQLPAVTRRHLDPRRFILCTDDAHAETLAKEGHMDRVLRHAISQGLDPMTAIQMVTLNTAEHFGVAKDMGLIAPGRWADILLVRDLRRLAPDLVIARGELVARNGRMVVSGPAYRYPGWARNSVHLRRPLKSSDLRLRAPARDARLRANVIGIVENHAPTKRVSVLVTPSGGEVRPDRARDIAKLALVQRYDGMSGIRVALVRGFGLKGRCAIASTVAHDCHHMLIVGTDEEQMALAGNRLAGMGGGQIVVKDGRTIGKVSLPIAGLMSDLRASVVARQAASVLAGFRACGCRLHNPNMQLSLLALVVIPELRLSDKGLFDVTHHRFLPVLERI